MAVVVTVAKGYDLGYIWKTQAEHHAGRTAGGYYINAAQAGEPPGLWWGTGAQALGFTQARSSSASPMTRFTGRPTREPEPDSAGPAVATQPSPITWPA